MNKFRQLKGNWNDYYLVFILLETLTVFLTYYLINFTMLVFVDKFNQKVLI